MIHPKDVKGNIDDHGRESQSDTIRVTMKVTPHLLATTGRKNILLAPLHETDTLQHDVLSNKIIMDIKKDILPIVVEVVEASHTLLLMTMNMIGVILILGTKGLDRHRLCHLQDMITEVGTTSIIVLKINTTAAEMIRKTFV